MSRKFRPKPKKLILSYFFPHLFQQDLYPVRSRYDYIVCDEPCSGDGTIRKNPDIWAHWSPGAGNGIHRDQYDIAKRGLELLKIGGEFAYSTCSINPIENEAVIARLIQESKGNLEACTTCSEQIQSI